MAPPVAGYLLWFDATQIAGTSDGSLLATWNDLSGNASNATQATGTKQPTYYSTTTAQLIGGNPVVQFSGGSRSLLSTGFAATAQPLTFFVVGRMDTLTNLTFFVSGNTGSTNVTFGDHSGLFSIFSGSAWVDGASANSSAHIFAIVFNGASSVVRVDGTQTASGDPGSSGLTTAGLYLGNQFGGAAGMVGVEGEIIVYPSSLSLANIQSVESYLTAKWFPVAYNPPHFRSFTPVHRASNW